jgi:flagellar assembly factor FliW
MKIQTRAFGEVDIEDDKIITFTDGIIGYPELTKFALIYDKEKGSSSIQWLQSVDEPGFALPVMNPLIVCPDYNPVVEDTILKPVGNLDENDMLVLVTVTIPKDIKEISVNLRGPIVINANECRACQVILDDEEYKIKFPIYDILEKNKNDKKNKKAGE